MTAIPHIVAAFVVAGIAGSAAIATSTAPVPRDAGVSRTLSCDLHLTAQGRSLTLRAEAQAPGALRGSYTLRITQSGAGGQARIDQGGEFELAPGTPTILAEARFQGRASDIDAELTVTADGLTRNCTALGL